LSRHRNLSKSKYINGLQCMKPLWVTINDAARMPPYSAATQHVFDQGHMIGSLPLGHGTKTNVDVSFRKRG